ncbi:MAG TPA: aminotransferase class I/II-fold pyridoxal phosphate-dependent enzyme [Pyrinomonadaceae bacterium]|nr:aminotransferase class I/II-fold pyridoxal phosphate-dependent enzyme [Pyrinomonadaceae bacterium]
MSSTSSTAELIAPSSRTEQFHYAIRNIVGAAEARERRGQKVVYLNIGDPQAYGFRPPGHVVEAVGRALRESFTGYAHSSGLTEAREAVASYATSLGAPTSPEDVLMTAGASEGADLLLTALVEEGDEVLLPAPGYPLYTAILNKLGARARFYRLEPSHGWQPSPEEIAALVNPRTRALVLINPNNPTGSIIPDETTRRLLELAERRNLLVVADEVYRELCFEQPPVPSSLIAAETGQPLVTLESLSKTHLVPGWRVGWMRYTNAEKMRGLVNAVNRLASGRLCSPTPAQYAVRPALEGDRGFLSEFVSQIRRRRDFVLEAVRGIEGLSCETPAAAFYAMLRVDDPLGRTDERFVLDLLEETGVLVVHGSGFGTDPKPCHFRLVYLADEAVLGTVFERLGDFMQTPAAPRR